MTVRAGALRLKGGRYFRVVWEARIPLAGVTEMAIATGKEIVAGHRCHFYDFYGAWQQDASYLLMTATVDGQQRQIGLGGRPSQLEDLRRRIAASSST